MKKLFVVLPILALCLFSSCAKEISPDVYADSQAGKMTRTYEGVIVSVNDVTVSGDDSLEENEAGMLTGAAAGAAVGSNVGKGGGKTAGTVAGAIIGGITGAYAEKQLKTQGAVEYVVRMSNGELKTLVQGPKPRFSVDQEVFIIENSGGRTRLRGK